MELRHSQKLVIGEKQLNNPTWRRMKHVKAGVKAGQYKIPASRHGEQFSDVDITLDLVEDLSKLDL